MVEALQFFVRWDRLAETCRSQAPVVPADGEVVVAIEKFALTSNNITYARTGEQFGYWHYFPAPAGWGTIPVWGFGRITDSRAPNLPEGTRIYGFLPMASHCRLRPEGLTQSGFIDIASHRTMLPPTYNEYAIVGAAPDFDPLQEDLHLVLRPLFSLAFFLVGFLERNEYFGAEQVLVSSASSKASLAIAGLLRSSGNASVGATSAARVHAIAKLGLFDRVVPYDDLAQLSSTTPTVFLDITGDSDFVRAVHTHFGEHLRHSSLAGFTHDFAAPTSDLPGPSPTLFFTPDHIVALRKSWGPDMLRQRLIASRNAVYNLLAERLRIRVGEGAAAIESAYAEVLAGRVPPDVAWVLHPTPRVP